MELKISHKKEEPLLSRTRLEGEVTFDNATPSTKEIKSNVAKSIGKDESLVDIRGIYNQYGQKKAKVVCYAYENKDVLKKIKIEGKKTKEKAGKEAKQEGAEAKEGKAEEKKEAKQEKAKEKKE
ncbi:hypothetical protein HYU09_02390 [Candidatus Woesearchaeota archaeon]|nr:hypothetical protein [Candidatus Woesearchaeota archaeon]